MDYKIIKRSDNEDKYNLIGCDDPNNHSDGQFSNRDYDKPLCGISNFDDNLKIGDIVGIKLETKKRFNKTSVIKSIVKEEYLKNYEDINIISDEHFYREDHLFKIKYIIEDKTLSFIGLNGSEPFLDPIPSSDSDIESRTKTTNITYGVEPIFLDDDKVIAHFYYCNVDIKINFEKKHLTEEFLINKFLYDYLDDNDENFEDFVKIGYRMVKLKEIVEQYKNNPNPENKSSIEKFELFDVCYKKLYERNLINDFKNEYPSVILSPSESEIYNYYTYIKDNFKILESILTEKQINNIGTLELYIESRKEIYRKLYDKLPDIVEHRIDYQYQYPPALCTPSIIHNISEISYDNIYRVYKEDPNYYTKKMKTITNWHGIILKESVRSLLNVSGKGQTVRIPIYNKLKNWCEYCRYFDIIHKISDDKFLGISTNVSAGNEYEDVIIIGDINSISETYGFDEYVIDKNYGYIITGVGAIDEGDETDNIIYKINYESLFN